MRFLVLKGVEGFGDRLQCLLQAVRYCKTTHRCLVVDWRDSDWTHDQSIPFEYYFQLEGISSISLSCFLELLSCQTGCSVFPEIWASRLTESGFESFIRDPDYALPENGACINAIATGIAPDFAADVVVYPGIGPRAFDYADVLHVKPKDCILQSIQKIVNQYQLVADRYDVIHLRGGTKVWAGGSLDRDNHPDREKHEQWEGPDRYLREIYDVLCLLNEGKIPLPTYILADTPCMASWWINRFGEGILLPNAAHGLMQGSGLHKIDSATLAACRSLDYRPLTKAELNIEAIRDFVIMNNCRSLVGDGLSLFSLMAYGLKTNHVRLGDLPTPGTAPDHFSVLPASGIWSF